MKKLKGDLAKCRKSILEGYSLQVAARMAGISAFTFYAHCKVSPEWDELRLLYLDIKRNRRAGA